MPYTPPYVVSIAPMMEHTDRFFRVFMRLFTQKTWLYTEMMSAGALVHGNAHVHLDFDSIEKPVALQLGGNEASELAQSVRIANEYDYDEINLNVGCPSERVHCGGFGAFLMAHVEKTQGIVQAMCAASKVPITVKCRLGIDGTRIGLPLYEEYKHLLHFATCMRNAGAQRLIVHARIAVLGGLSPKENRQIPPLKYDYVRCLKDDLATCFGACFVEINGGIKTLEDAREHLRHVDAVMIGRAAVDTPCMFWKVDDLVDEHSALNTSRDIRKRNATIRYTSAHEEHKKRQSIARAYGEYLQGSLQRVRDRDEAYQRAVRMHSLALKHSMNLFSGLRGAKRWRQRISAHMHAQTEPLTAIEDALQHCV